MHYAFSANTLEYCDHISTLGQLGRRPKLLLSFNLFLIHNYDPLTHHCTRLIELNQLRQLTDPAKDVRVYRNFVLCHNMEHVDGIVRACY